MTKPFVTIYTDGSARPNPGPGGWAALLIYGGVEKALSGGEKETTNNRMELTAACEALEALNRPCEVELYTDSEYLKMGITTWLPAWTRRNWRTSNGKPVLNQDLWERLYAAAQRHTVSWEWTRGHAGNIYNERADQLAAQARLKFQNSPHSME